MEAALANLGRLAVLALPALFGALAAQRHLLGPPALALTTLNAFALYFAFPALVIAGLLDDRFVLPDAWAFWLLVPAADLVLVALARALARLGGRPHDAGTLALVAIFGNVAYLGLPLVAALLGPAYAGAAALVVSIHVALSVTFGPVLLARWSGPRPDTGAHPRSPLRQPLFWAPWLGLVARALPDAAQVALRTALTPLAAAAAPVALFMLGVYLHAERAALHHPPPGVAVHVGLRLLLVPAITAALAAAAVAAGALPAADLPLFVLLAAMPVGITTFSIALEAGVGTERVAATIVWSTLLAAVTLPLVATLLGAG